MVFLTCSIPVHIHITRINREFSSAKLFCTFRFGGRDVAVLIIGNR